MSTHVSHARARRGTHEPSNPARSWAKPAGGTLAGLPRRGHGGGRAAGAGRGRAGQVAAAGGGSGRARGPARAGRSRGPALRPPLAARLLLASPWWSGATRRRCCAGPRAPPSPRRRPRTRRREAGAGAAAGAAGRPRSRGGGASPRRWAPPRCCCSPGAWSWATWRRTRWWPCSWSPSIPARVRAVPGPGRGSPPPPHRDGGGGGGARGALTRAHTPAPPPGRPGPREVWVRDSGLCSLRPPDPLSFRSAASLSLLSCLRFSRD